MELDMDFDMEAEPAFEIVNLDCGIALCMLRCVVCTRGECMRVCCGAWYACVLGVYGIVHVVLFAERVHCPHRRSIGAN